MKVENQKFKIFALIFIGMILCFVSIASGNGQREVFETGSGSGKYFLYSAKKFGISILRASIKIDNGTTGQGRPVYLIRADVHSLKQFEFLFRMNNRFASLMQAETCSPIRYTKEIDQDGFFIKKKSYLQILTFDHPNRKMTIEEPEKKERQEIFLPPDTYDPLSMFALYYLKEELQPKQDIRMSIHDGVKLREMIFHSKKERVTSMMFGEVNAICLESTTSFSSFGDKEGMIRIWYTADRKKTPISLELDLPIGNVKFELEEARGG